MIRRLLLPLLTLSLTFNAWGQTETTGQENASDPAEQARFVQFETTLGDFVIELFREQAPVSAANFLQYVTDGFYDGTVFHRVIGNFVLQGGGFNSKLEKKPTREPIVNEADNMLANSYGTLAMARTAHPHSATSQFYINVADNTALNHTGKTNSRAWGYAVFGRVVSGLEVIEAIRAVPTGPGGQFGRDVPQTPIVVTAARVVASPPQATPAEPGTDAAGAGESAQP